MSEVTTSYTGGLSVDEVRDRVKAERIYKLSSNENALGPSPLALAAARDAAATMHLYPPRDGETFRQRLAEHHGLDKDHFFLGNGGYEVLELVARTLLTEGDDAIICPPTFGVYARTARAQGAKVVAVPLREDFSLDAEGVLKAMGERTRLVYLCNPNNPTGTVTSQAAFERLLDGLPAGVVLVHDDVYCDFVGGEGYPDSLGYIRAGKALVAVRTFSKVYGLAGLRLGYGIAAPELAQRVRARCRTFHISSVALAAGEAALQDEEHRHKSVKAARVGKAYLYEALAHLGVHAWPSEANFVLIKVPQDAGALEAELLRRGVMVRETAGNGLPDCLRVSVGTPEANAAFIAALAESIGAK